MFEDSGEVETWGEEADRRDSTQGIKCKPARSAEDTDRGPFSAQDGDGDGFDLLQGGDRKKVGYSC